MTLEEFLKAVIPDDGRIIVANKLPKYMQHTGFDPGDYRTAAQHCIAHSYKKQDTYIAVASFKSGRERKQTNVQSHKALWLDIDVGSDKEYADKNEAVTAIRGFINTAGLPAPSILVQSGTGFHMYWVLDKAEPVTSGNWQAASDALVRCCQKNALAIDTAVTRDSARLLRPPETQNFKHAAPQNVSITFPNGSEPQAYPLDTLRQHLKPYGAFVQAAPTIASPLAGMADDELGAGIHTGRTVLAKNIFEGCPWFRHIKETGGQDQGYDQWRAAMNILSICADGRDYIHVVSDKHSEYTVQRTEAKYENSLQAETQHRHRLCSAIAGYGTPQCVGCPHASEEGMHPHELGVPAEEIGWPAGWRMSRAGLEHAVESSTGVAWTPVWRKIVRDLNVVSLDGEPAIRVDLSKPTAINKSTFVHVLASKLSDHATFDATLMKIELPSASDNETKQLRRFMKSWYASVLDGRSVKRTSKHMGWSDDLKSFGLIDSIQSIDTSGNLHEAARSISGMPANRAGRVDRWTAAAKIITDQDWGPHLALLASTFAAPLVKFSSAISCQLHVHTPNSGVGKSTTLKMAQAVWANPRTTPIRLDDTYNATNALLGQLNTLPVYWDEAIVPGKGDSQRLTEFILRVSEGREKRRLDVEARTRPTAEWSTMLVTCGNYPISTMVSSNKVGTIATGTRILEINMGMPQLAHGEHELLDAITTDWGVAGTVYAQYLLTHLSEVRAAVRAVETQVRSARSMPQEHRFLAATITTLLVGAQLANKARLTDFNLATLRQTLLAAYKPHDRQVNAQAASRDALSWVLDYIKDTAKDRVLFDTVHSVGRQQRKHIPTGLSHVQHSISYEQGRDDGGYCIASRDLNQWLRRNHVQTAVVNDALGQLPFARYGLRRLGKEVEGLRRPHRERVWIIDGSHEEYQAAIDDLDDLG